MTFEPFSMRSGFFRLTTIALAAAAFCFVLFSRVSAEELRTWSDVTGKYKIKAKFVSASEGKVTLEREDGAKLTIPLEKLCEADQKVVAETQANDQNPFKVVKPARKSARRTKAREEPEEERETADTSSGEAKVVRPRWSDVKQVLLASGDSKWSVPIDAPPPSADRKERAVALPAKLDFFEQAKALAINPICRRAVMGYILDKPGEDHHIQTRVVLCDLQNGKLLGAGKTPGKMIPLALNDAGTDVLMCSDEFGFGKHDRLEIWNLTEAGISKRLQWTPHDDQHSDKRDIKWARYVGADKLLTFGSGGQITLWDATTAQPIYWLQSEGRGWPALSPNRKYLAFVSEKQIGVLDVNAGEVIAQQSTPHEFFQFPVFAFTPKGTRLACSTHERVYVWDVATGALFRDISLAGMKVFAGENLICPSEDLVLVGKKLLVDIETQAKLWTYEGHELVDMLGGVCWFALAGETSGALLPAVLPQPSAKAKIQKALESPDFFVLKPGVTVKLNVSALQDPGEREKATAAFMKQIQANGCQVGPNGTVELVAATDPGKRREVAYRTFGRPIAREYTVQEYLSRVKIVWQGQTAWEVSCSSVPGFVHLKEGETIQQYLQQHEHPDYEWFGKVELPKVVQKPTSGATTLGTTQVTISGLR